ASSKGQCSIPNSPPTIQMAGISEQLKPDTYRDKTFISKRSFRKTLVSKRRYAPAESDVTTYCREDGFALHSAQETLPFAGWVSAIVSLNLAAPDGQRFSESLADKGGACEPENVSQKVQSDQDARVLANHMAGQDPSNSTNHMAEQYASMSANHVAEAKPSNSASHPEQQDPSVSSDHMAEEDLGAPANHDAGTEEAFCFASVRLKLEDDSVESCDSASPAASQQKTTADRDVGKAVREQGPDPREKQAARPLFVFGAMRKRSVEGDTENRPYKCTFCNWAFKKSSNLLSHMDTHSGLKPHICDLCGKAYTWSSDHRKHIRTHTGEKPYVCSECGKEFVRSSDLRKHERNLHGNDKPFPCTTCGKTFNRPLSLMRHERTHLGARPFLCSDCGKAFGSAGRLAEHRKVLPRPG
uniref:Zinc finger protein 648 n=1 Tax=Electrophorus electricus TaxID=8005 RepID=A0AAY5E8G3_ELEEL